MPHIQPVEPENTPGGETPGRAGHEGYGGAAPNFHKQISNSPISFEAYLNFSGTMQGGSLDRQMQEAIALAVSGFNGCKY